MEVWHWVSIILFLINVIIGIFMMYLKQNIKNLEGQIMANKESIERKRLKMDKFDKDMVEIKDNYIDRFEEIKDLINDVKVKLVRIEDKVQNQADFCKINLEKGKHP